MDRLCFIGTRLLGCLAAALLVLALLAVPNHSFADDGDPPPPGPGGCPNPVNNGCPVATTQTMCDDLACFNTTKTCDCVWKPGCECPS